MTSLLDAMRAQVSAAAGVAAAARPTLIEEKGRHDFVTDMDRRLEDMLRSGLEPLFGVSVLGEESIADDDALPDAAVLIDPLDGTGNWIAGIPFSAVSVALVIGGVSTLAVVAAIGSGIVYSARAGAGAWRNDERMSLGGTVPQPLVALTTGLMDALGAGPGYRDIRAYGKLRNFGSQALQLCAVAQGALALNASLEARLWDDAAGRLIATEAGATYRAFLAPDRAAYPVSQQRSLCVHPAIAAQVESILAPYLNPHRS